MTLPRSGHIYYDLRKLLANPLLLLALVGLAGLASLFFGLQAIFAVSLLIAAMFAGRGLIGRRCPRCDGPLKETGAARDPVNAFVMHITWRCPRDGYEETEKTKGDSGLFGVG